MCALWKGHWYFVPYKIGQLPDFKQLKVFKILAQNFRIENRTWPGSQQLLRWRFRVSAAVYMRPLFFWVVTQRGLVLTDVLELPVGPIFKSQIFQECSWSAWLLKMGPIGCLETSVRSYYSTLRKIPREMRSHASRPLKNKLLSFTRLSYILNKW
jgi:hypothetical protein